MNKKFKLSATVLALLTLTLMLFYQNCAQQSDDLGIGSTTPPSPTGGGTNPFKAECINRGNNKFNVKFENVGPNPVVSADVNNLGRPASTPQRDLVPLLADACPGGNSTAFGCPAPDQTYTDKYGPWVWAGCPCFKASTHNFTSSSAINGYVSGYAANAGYDLTDFASYNSIEIYVKENKKNGAYNPTGRNATGNHAVCFPRP